MGPRRRLSRRRALLVGGASALAACLLAEGALRFLLFGEGDLAERWGASLRADWNFTHWQSEEAYVLQATFAPKKSGVRHPLFDAELGWTRDGIEPGSRRHEAEARLGDRRPILFYGDSFVRCATEPVDCWEGIVERSALAGDHVLVNFGVDGYGVRQIYLLLNDTIDRFVERDPIVVVGILVDDDLDRSDLPLRHFPKPRFILAEGDLVLRPPEHATAAEYAAANPAGIRSYAWRYLLFGSRVVPRRIALRLTGDAARVERTKALNRRLVEEIRRELVARGLEHFFVLFHGTMAMHEVGPYGWQEPFLYEVFEELGAPFVSSKRALLEDADRHGRVPFDYFHHEMPGKDHYLPMANEVVFEALLRGLRGELEAYDYLPGAPPHPRERL